MTELSLPPVQDPEFPDDWHLFGPDVDEALAPEHPDIMGHVVML